MILNLAVAALVLGMGYLWALRGFFNALLHLVAVIIGGAVAFAVWELASLALVNASPAKGFTSVLGATAWSIGLIVPFVAATIGVRVLLDKLIPANVVLARPLDMAGAAVCGLGIAILSVGIGLIGLSSTRLSPGFMGYQPLWYNPERAEGGGSLRLNDSLWIPADKLAGAFYGSLSRRAFSASDALGTWYPDLHAVAYANRIAPEKAGAPRNAYKPSEFSITRRYTVGDTASGSPTADLLSYELDGQRIPQRYADTRGRQVPSGHIEGFVIQFNAGAKDAGARGAGQVVFTNGQARLVCRDEDGSTFNVFPVAMISQASSGETVYGRWRFDAEGVQLASVGGASTVSAALEFLVPAGAEPIGLFIKGVRVELDGSATPTAYASAQDRDANVTDGGILRGAAQEARPTLDTSSVATISPETEGIEVTNSLGRPRVLHSQIARQGFDLDEDNRVTGGRLPVTSQMASNPPTDRRLRVDRFAVARDQIVVQIDAGPGQPADLLSPTAALLNADLPIRLIDTNGQFYDAVGFNYKDSSVMADIRYSPTSPLSGTRDLPPLSGSRSDQELTLIFMCSLGVEIEYLAIGDTALLRFDPPLALDRAQN